MKNIIVANASMERAEKIAAVLRRSGFCVAGCVNSGAQVIEFSRRCSGIVVCGAHLADMPVQRLPDLAAGSDFLFTLSASQWFLLKNTEACLGVRIPIVCAELTNSLFLLQSLSCPSRESLIRRSYLLKDESAVIERAKGLLMERNGLSEEQAHRFLQKKSMNYSKRMAESALLVLESR